MTLNSAVAMWPCRTPHDDRVAQQTRAQFGVFLLQVKAGVRSFAPIQLPLGFARPGVFLGNESWVHLSINDQERKSWILSG